MSVNQNRLEGLKMDNAWIDEFTIKTSDSTNMQNVSWKLTNGTGDVQFGSGQLFVGPSEVEISSPEQDIRKLVQYGEIKRLQDVYDLLLPAKPLKNGDSLTVTRTYDMPEE